MTRLLSWPAKKISNIHVNVRWRRGSDFALALQMLKAGRGWCERVKPMTWNVFREHALLQELAVIHEAEEALGRDYAGLCRAKKRRTTQYASFLAGLRKLQSRVDRLDQRLEVASGGRSAVGANC